jgi:hypothetical protein
VEPANKSAADKKSTPSKDRVAKLEKQLQEEVV